MRRLPIRALLPAYLLLNCAGPKVDKGFFAPDQPKYFIELDEEGRKHGMEKWWHPNGQQKYEATNDHGIREGRFMAWFPDGAKWYEGVERHGKPESTLTYWHPNGKVKSQALFRDGIQLERKDWDESGALLVPRSLLSAPTEVQVEKPDEAAELRKAGLQAWAARVRQAVESYWVLPDQFDKQRPYKSVATIKVHNDGRILDVTWTEKSPSSAFNTLAQQTFKKIKRLPAFPPEVMDLTLEIQYEFVSMGKTAPRKKLELHDPKGAAEPTE